MNRILTIVLILLIGANGAYAWYQNKHAAPTDTELDADIAKVEAEIATAQADTSQYKGAPLAMTTARIEILKTTHAMLSQKKTALIRGIGLSYTIDGAPMAPPDPKRLAEIEADMKAQRAKTALAETQALTTGD